MTYPRISVVTPSLNQGEFLPAALESLHDQRYPNLEHIVMDGGSTDGTLAALEMYSDRLAFVQSRPDAGQTDALIQGFARATGEILAWLNADDVLEPGTLLDVGNYFASHPTEQFVFGDSSWIDRDGRMLKRKREMPFVRSVWLRTYDYIPQPSAFWRRSLYEASGGLDQSFELAMDADLFARMAELSPLRHVRRQWSRMRQHPGQRNLRYRQISDAEEMRIRARYLHRTSGPIWILERTAARSMRIACRAALGAYLP